jgi:ABC-type sugar transport system permease subunit
MNTDIINILLCIFFYIPISFFLQSLCGLWSSIIGDNKLDDKCFKTFIIAPLALPIIICIIIWKGFRTLIS